MNERRILTGWKEISTYLSRGVRTVQRWELTYGMPVRRQRGEVRSVFAFADEVDAWPKRAEPKARPYVRPTVLSVDIMTPTALSDLKLATEGAKFNVLTAFTYPELIATAARYDVDTFVIDSIILDKHPSEVAEELRRLYPSKPCVLIGDDHARDYDAAFSSGDTAAVVGWLIEKFGMPEVSDRVEEPV
jgi:hypothetical protein